MANYQTNYDEISDTLYVSFEAGQEATGIELNPNILLRVDKVKEKAIGITFFDYSLLAQKATFGPRSFPLTGLAELSEELQELVVNILQTPPLTEILMISTYIPPTPNQCPSHRSTNFHWPQLNQHPSNHPNAPTTQNNTQHATRNIPPYNDNGRPTPNTAARAAKLR